MLSFSMETKCGSVFLCKPRLRFNQDITNVRNLTQYVHALPHTQGIYAVSPLGHTLMYPQDTENR